MITGEKTFLRGIVKEDAPIIYQWVNLESLRASTGTLYPISEYEHEDWIKRTVTASDKKLFMICDKESGTPIGTIGLKNFDNLNRRVELYISIGNEKFLSNPNSKGGFGTDAVKTLVNYCFTHLNIHKVTLNVYESNKRAIRCYEKAGFIQEGVLKQHHFSNGKYEDVFVMGIISDYN